jgi:hypothetical protein
MGRAGSGVVPANFPRPVVGIVRHWPMAWTGINDGSAAKQSNIAAAFTLKNALSVIHLVKG